MSMFSRLSLQFRHRRRSKAAAKSLVKVPKFAHEPLDDPTSQIRVLRIQPGQGEDVIHCTLTHQALEQDKHVCLSYCWGDEPATETICINGRPFAIRPNLYQFLLTARSRSIFQPLWIDAICIVQSHSAEKGAQVQMMGEIYRLSRMAIVWFGLQPEELHPLEQFIDVLRKRLTEREFENHLVRYYNDAIEWMQMLVLVDGYDARHTHCWAPAETAQRIRHVHTLVGPTLAKTMSCRYWFRAWIVQELLLSKPHIMLPSGFLDARIYYILSSPLIFLHPFDFPPRRRSWPRIRALGVSKDMWRSIDSSTRLRASGRLTPGLAPQSWLDIVALMMERGCFDIRDRIYSCQSFLALARRVPVDYTISKELLCLEILRLNIWEHYGDEAYDLVRYSLSAMEFDIREVVEYQPSFWVQNDMPLRVAFVPYSKHKRYQDGYAEGMLGLHLLSPIGRRLVVLLEARIGIQGNRSRRNFRNLSDSFLYLSGQWVKIPSRSRHNKPCPTIWAGSG